MEHSEKNNPTPSVATPPDFDVEVSETVRKYFKDTLRQARIFGENIGYAINEALEDEYRRGREEALEDLFSEASIDSGLIVRLDKCGWAVIEKHRLEDLLNNDRRAPIRTHQGSFEAALESAWREYNDSGARTVDGCEENYVECAHAKGFREGYLFGQGQPSVTPVQVEALRRCWQDELVDAAENPQTWSAIRNLYYSLVKK